MEKFAGYGFNKSHSVAYAFISYQTAFLKTYYTSEFLAAALSSDMDNTDKVISLIDAAKEMKITILQPDINVSDFNFISNNKKNILFGLGAVKGVGQNAASHIINERQKNGDFTNLFDFCERISLNIVNTGTIESLIYSGAFDVFNECRLTQKNLLEKAMSYGNHKQSSKSSGQQELFENKSDSFVSNGNGNFKKDKYFVQDTKKSRLNKLFLERKVIGFYLSGHPINEYSSEINAMSINKIDTYLKRFYSISSTSDFSESTTISGVIINIRSQRMGQDKFINILTVDDSSGRLEVIVYPDIYQQYQNIIKENEILFFAGVISVDEYNSGLSLKVTKIFNIENARQRYSKEIELLLTPDLSNDDVLQKIVGLLEPHKNGKCPLTIKCISDKHIVPLNLNNEWLINPSSTLINSLSDLLGKENIIVKYQ
jgi:DNA polymerase-3 subunit alpha